MLLFNFNIIAKALFYSPTTEVSLKLIGTEKSLQRNFKT